MLRAMKVDVWDTRGEDRKGNEKITNQRLHRREHRTRLLKKGCASLVLMLGRELKSRLVFPKEFLPKHKEQSLPLGANRVLSYSRKSPSFITAFTKAPLLSKMNPIQKPKSCFLNMHISLSSCLRLGLPSDLFLFRLFNKNFICISYVPYTRYSPTQFLLFDSITLITGIEYKLWISVFRSVVSKLFR